MVTSLSYLFSSESTREIDNAYHLAMVAENTQQIVAYQAATLQAQIGLGLANLEALYGIAEGQNLANSYLQQMARDLSAMHNLSEIVTERLNDISQQLAQQQRVLENIAEVLRHSYDAKALELRREAEKWLNSGAKNTGRDRKEDWKDAMRLLRTTIDNPIGMQDYVAWFQLGWLLWKQEQNFVEAEEAFYRAYRLSAQQGDLYYVLSIRHLAYMQYFQGKYEEAYQTIQKALRGGESYIILYETARYAAKAGHEQEYLALLDKCIDLQPTTIITMFSEADFL